MDKKVWKFFFPKIFLYILNETRKMLSNKKKGGGETNPHPSKKTPPLTDSIYLFFFSILSEK